MTAQAGSTVSEPQSRPYKTLDDLQNIAGQIVLVRVDLNVPAENGVVTDTTRIDRIKPTLEALRDKGAKIVLLSHFGRPKGERNLKYSLAFLAPFMSRHLGMNINFAEDCIGKAATNAIDALGHGDILLLENLRFHAGEEANDDVFVQDLSALGDIYINDAFSAAHRAHASTAGLAAKLPAYAGLLMDAELTALRSGLESPARPLMALVGGAKISTKLDLLQNLIEKVDMLVLGGGMANTFLAAQGHDMKASLCEHDMLDTARQIMTKAQNIGCEIILPVDLVCAQEFKAQAPHKTYTAAHIEDGYMALDIGPESCATIEQKLEDCKTLVWNGPLGAFEIEPFDRGTNRLAQYAAKTTQAGHLMSVAGGGDTVSALNQAGVADGFSYLSSAGGAFLEWLEGKKLPGVAALQN